MGEVAQLGVAFFGLWHAGQGASLPGVGFLKLPTGLGDVVLNLKGVVVDNGGAEGADLNGLTCDQVGALLVGRTRNVDAIGQLLAVGAKGLIVFTDPNHTTGQQAH